MSEAKGTKAALLACALAPWLAGGVALLVDSSRSPRPEAKAAAERVVAGRAYELLAKLQAEAPARTPGSPSHAAGVAWIESAFSGAGLVDVKVREHPGELRNVVGVLPGERPERIVLCAHHDVVPDAPGAVDDGGAVAALVAVAEALAAGPRPPYTLEFAAFDGEEWGCLGSKAHVAEGGPVRVALAVELVGWREDRLVTHTLPYGFAWEAPGVAPGWAPQALDRAGAAAGAPVSYGDPLFSPWYQASVRLLKLRTGSDAGAYSEAGIPALMLTGSSLTNFYEAYHQSTDSMEQVDSARLDEATRVIAAAAWELGEPAGADKALGESRLVLGQRSLGRGALALVALLAALASALGAWRAAKGVRLGLGALAAGLLLVATSGSVAGVVCFVPLVSAALVRLELPRGPGRALLVLGLLPLVMELLLIAAASLMFGFGWRGGGLETAALLLAFVGAVLACGRVADSAPAGGDGEGGEEA